MRSVPVIIRMHLRIYGLCDEYGIYMIAENNHGISRKLGYQQNIPVTSAYRTM